MILRKPVIDLNSYLESKKNLINKKLEKIIDTHTNLISKAVRYSLMSGGKRLRPVLCIAAADAVGGDGKNVLPAACALEMIHTYSLIHDDLPAISLLMKLRLFWREMLFLHCPSRCSHPSIQTDMMQISG
jgi:geranylgeranyl diphosphate synthase type II